MFNIEERITPFRNFCYKQHDIVCNQKYNKNLPYSFHLMCVEKQADKFKYLLTEQEYFIAKCGTIAHDLIEDANITYNDVVQITKNMLINPFFDNKYSDNRIAEVIYRCTELRGRTRAERHGPDYIKELKDDKIAVFVKLCDIAANMLFSKLTNSSMYKKYKVEFPNFKESCFIEEFSEIFNYIENI